jgi:hypothetical protein
MADKEQVERIDASLMRRISELSPGAQRWLKTAVQTMRTMPPKSEQRPVEESPPPHLRRLPEGKKRRPKAPEAAPPTLDDVITGKRQLEEAEQYPEIAEELEGLGDLIDKLRSLGQSRRELGEQILRDEILRGSDAEEDDDFGF